MQRLGRRFSLVAGRGPDKVDTAVASLLCRLVMAPHPPPSEDVDQLLLNARLRDELEPFLDESVHILDCRRLSTSAENEFLAQMLAWERAPVLPISKWFDPELILPAPDQLDDQQLRTLLAQTIERLYSRRIVLDFTDHLSDRDRKSVV